MSNQPFCHLHGHSEFSQRDTVGSAKEIVEVAAKRGFESVPFTDHGTGSRVVRVRWKLVRRGFDRGHPRHRDPVKRDSCPRSLVDDARRRDPRRGRLARA